MMREIQDGKDKIINDIELKLQQLRMNRNAIEEKRFGRPSSAVHAREVPKSAGNVGIIDRKQQMQLSSNLRKLEQLYEAKKQLRQAGIETNDPRVIDKFKQDPKMGKMLEKKKKQVAVEQQKMQIVAQEMEKTRKFLNSKNIQQKQIKSLQVMNYKNILKQKQQILEEYHSLLCKGNLSRIEKQTLIGITFNFLKERVNYVSKQKVRNFLISNPEFCAHFYITHAEINRDLQVYETAQRGLMTETELFQFIKSIQITNPAINPSSKRLKQNKKQSMKIAFQLLGPSQKSNEQKKLSDRETYRKIMQYLRKLFKNIDRSNESIADRSKFVASLQKGLYWDVKNNKDISKKQLEQLGNFIEAKTKQRCRKEYYKELESKFIILAEIEQIAKQFIFRPSDKAVLLLAADILQANIEEQKDQQLEEYDEQQYDAQQSEGPETYLNPIEGKRITAQDYDRYGWSQQKTQGVRENSLEQVDKYYCQLREKYGNEISWNGYDQYKADFRQLEQFIKLQEQNKDKIHNQ